MSYGETRENMFDEEICPRCGEPLSEDYILATGLDLYGQHIIIHDDCLMEGDPDYEG